MLRYTVTYMGLGVKVLEGIGVFQMYTCATVPKEVAERLEGQPDWMVTGLTLSEDPAPEPKQEPSRPEPPAPKPTPEPPKAAPAPSTPPPPKPAPPPAPKPAPKGAPGPQSKKPEPPKSQAKKG